jgi:Cys-tRNA(Pro) deacylase
VTDQPAHARHPNVQHPNVRHPNVERVIDAGRVLGIEVVPRTFPEGTRTAVDAAKAIGCDVAQIVKSLIFGVDGEVVLAYVSGRNQLDESRLAAAAGGEACQRVDADAVRQATGFPIGGVPPFGHTSQLRIFIDPDLLIHEEIWAAAGTWHDVFALTPDDLLRVTGATVCDLART